MGAEQGAGTVRASTNRAARRKPPQARRLLDRAKPLGHYRIRRRYLTADGYAEFLPIGSFFRRTRDALFRDRESLYAKANGWTADVLPAYEATELVKLGKGRSVRLRLWGVVKETEEQYAKSLVRRVHYLDGRMRGMMLVCSFDSHKEQELVRTKRATDVDERWSPAWSDPPGRIVACAVLDRLLHGLPLGRVRIPPDVDTRTGSMRTRAKRSGAQRRESS
jgi:hypothetical protein